MGPYSTEELKKMRKESKKNKGIRSFKRKLKSMQLADKQEVSDASVVSKREKTGLNATRAGRALKVKIFEEQKRKKK